MAAQIVFDGGGDSQVFAIGEDRIYFSRDECPHTGYVHSITVAYASTGEPWSRTTAYITFATEADAERFLWEAQHQQRLPYGWQ